RGDDGGRRPRIDAERDPQPVAEARFLNRDVVVEQLELLLQCDERTALAVKRLAQELREPRDHPIGLLGVLEHEGRYLMHRIKEEVRLEMPDEHIDPRLHGLRLEPRYHARV